MTDCVAMTIKPRNLCDCDACNADRKVLNELLSSNAISLVFGRGTDGASVAEVVTNEDVVRQLMHMIYALAQVMRVTPPLSDAKLTAADCLALTSKHFKTYPEKVLLIVEASQTSGSVN